MADIILEFCQNHNGDRTVLTEMIHAAAETGARFAKIQSIWIKDLTHRPQFETGKTAPDGKILTIKRPFQPEYDRLKGLELSLDDHAFFIEECGKRGITPLTTIFARVNIPAVAGLNWPKRMVKVASYDCASYPMLLELKKSFETLWVSTGATHDSEIEQAAKLLNGSDFAFFHCVTMYPNRLEDCHLARIDYLKQFTPKVGWSDHTFVATDGIKAAKAALALGANLVERHFTILPADKTKDGPVSINPALASDLAHFARLSKDLQLKEAKKDVPDWEAIIGQRQRDLTEPELLNRDYYRGRFASIKDGKPRYNWET